SRYDFVRKLIDVFYERTNADLTPGTFRVVGNAVEIMPPALREIIRVELSGSTIKRIARIDAVSRSVLSEEETFFLFPARHFVTPESQMKRALSAIESELKDRLTYFDKAGKLLEADRLKRRTNYDLALLREVGYCNGVENYSRHFDGRAEGEATSTLLSYFPEGFLTIIDESHVAVPQIGGMYNGDRARKKNLLEHGFRLPSALDNRPLQFHEFEERVGQVIYTSATPADYELEKGKDHIVEQIIRPTGLLDPHIEVRPIQQSGKYPGQAHDFIAEAEKVIKNDARVIATTLTKAMAEDLSSYLKDKNIKAEYLHSDIKTIERIEILTNFRRGVFDILVGVNLLREGLDL
ncbi:excinuclease ABC subunit B, partial [Candidatus Woesearchaeota archaeon]|nr:excinuclease ABC subunit B [Candidatus Woesearchaeota archaeon]